jgi:hypothetical protein
VFRRSTARKSTDLHNRKALDISQSLTAIIQFTSIIKMLVATLGMALVLPSVVAAATAPDSHHSLSAKHLNSQRGTTLAARADCSNMTFGHDSNPWAGGIVSGKSVTSVSGEFVAVMPKPPPCGNGASTFTYAPWVGIGGANECQSTSPRSH